jgi:hypothetical protein
MTLKHKNVVTTFRIAVGIKEFITTAEVFDLT